MSGDANAEKKDESWMDVCWRQRVSREPQTNNKACKKASHVYDWLLFTMESKWVVGLILSGKAPVEFPSN